MGFGGCGSPSFRSANRCSALISSSSALAHGGVRGGTPPASAGSGGANGNYYPQLLELADDVAAEWVLALWTMAPTPAKAARPREARLAGPANGARPPRG